jgi:hypothetical protein
MNTLQKNLCAAIAMCCALPSLVFAGAGANVNACIFLPTKPITPLSVNFTAGGSIDHCMNNTGNNVSFTASQAGVTCGSVGYVEGKSSSSGGDTCATDDSIWVLSYSVASTSYSGSTQSTWSHPFLGDNHINLQQYSKGTVVCANANLCTSTSQVWDSGTQGPLYIIFQPQAPGASAMTAAMKKTPATAPQEKPADKKKVKH